MKQKVYLAGGMHNDWRNMVYEKANPYFVFFDPMWNGMPEPPLYSMWDIHWVKQCDILFVYIDKENPSGWGTMLEIGYGKASDKTIILVDETDNRYFKIAHHVADVVFDNIHDGIEYLVKFGLYQ